MAIYKTLSIVGFALYKDACIELANQGFVRIIGLSKDHPEHFNDNGSGKTSLLNALLWCLFGKTLMGVEGDDIINKDSPFTCVTIVLEKDGEEYSITRYRRHPEKKNDLVLTPSYQHRLKADTQSQVIDIVGADIHGFTNSVMWGNTVGKLKHFTDWSNSARKEFFESLFDYAWVKKAGEKASSNVRLIEEEIRRLNESINIKTAESVGLFDYMAELKTQILELNTKDTEELGKIKNTLDEMLKEQQSILEDLKVVEAERIEQAAVLESARKDHELYKAEYNRAIIKFSKEESRLNTESRIRVAQHQELEGISNSENVICPTCMSKLDKDHIQKVASKLLVEIDRVAKELDILSNGDLNKDVSIYYMLVVECSSLVTSAQYKLSEIDFDIKSLQASNLSVKNVIQQLSAEYDAAKNVAGSAANMQKLLEEKDAQWQRLVNDITDLSEEVEEYEHALSGYTFWVKMFSLGKLRSLLLSNFLVDLNKRARYYSEVITGNVIVVQFRDKRQLKSGDWREEFWVEVTNSSGAPVLDANSSGERRRVNWIVSATFVDFLIGRTRLETNMIMIDEYFENLDECGMVIAFDLLKKLTVQEYESVFVTTHNQIPPDVEFDKTIVCTREDNKARVIVIDM